MRDILKIFDKRMLITLLVLLVIAGLSLWLRNLVEPAPAHGQLRHIPDYTMENFTAKSMGTTGLLENEMQATYMAHYQDDDTAEFTKPHITVVRGNSPPWHLYAEQGWLAGDRKSTLMRGKVLIENPAAPAANVFHLVTKDLHVMIDNNYAETDQPVTIRGQSSIIKAVGMHAYLKEGRVELLSEVRGSYIPSTTANNP